MLQRGRLQLRMRNGHGLRQERRHLQPCQTRQMRETGTKTIELGLTRGKKKHGKDTQHQRRKKEEQNHFCQHKLVFSRASERQSQFILWHKNYNDRKKDTIFLWT